MPIHEREILYRIFEQVKKLSEHPPTTYAPVVSTTMEKPQPRPVTGLTPPSTTLETYRGSTTIR